MSDKSETTEHSDSSFTGEALRVGMRVALCEIGEQLMSRHHETQRLSSLDSDVVRSEHRCYGRFDDLRAHVGIPFTVIAVNFPLIVLEDIVGDGGAISVANQMFVSVTDDYCRAYKKVAKRRLDRQNVEEGGEQDQPSAQQLMNHIGQLQQQLQVVSARAGKITELNDLLVTMVAEARTEKVAKARGGRKR